MELNWLEDAVTLIEEGNLSRAAARRNVTQPAFSRRIRSLEDWAGISLLDRSSNRVELRDNLRDNEAEIRAILQRIEGLRSSLVQHVTGQETLSIATQHALTVSAFPEMHAALATGGQMPNWRLRTLNRSDSVSLFLRGDAELLLCYEARGLPPLPFDATVERLRWHGDALIPVVGRQVHARIGRRGEIPPGIARISYPPESHFGRLLAESDAGKFLRPSADSPSVSTAFTGAVLELVVSGLGVGWLPRAMVRRELAAGVVVSLEDTRDSFPLDVSLFAVSGSKAGISALGNLRDHLKSVGATA